MSRREYSRLELAGKLERCGYHTDALSPVLDTLESEGLLQDQRFAEAYVVSRTARGFGPVRIRMELKQRGVAPELIDACCNVADPVWSELASEVWSKRFAGTRASSFGVWAKHARYLQQRGFDTSQINATLGDFEEHSNEDSI